MIFFDIIDFTLRQALSQKHCRKHKKARPSLSRGCKRASLYVISTTIDVTSHMQNLSISPA